MLEELSYTITRNTELLGICIVGILYYGLISMIFKYLNFKEKKVEERKPILPFLPSSKHTIYTKKDYYYIFLLTGLYAIVSFWRLGNPIFPTTTWQPQEENQSIVFKLEDPSFDSIYAIYGEGDNNSSDAYQIGFHGITLEGSKDLKTWANVSTFDDGSIYQYMIQHGTYDYDYIRLTSHDIHDTISEIGFLSHGSFVPVSIQEDKYSESKYPATLLIDEQDKLVVEPTYYDQGYFDEIYHPRNAWEILNGQYMYAHVHPLFGTSIMALFMGIFGVSPFGWRIAGAFFGVLLVPLFYCLIKEVFDETKYCFLGTLYLCIGFLHLTTSRIGTLEPFSVFFILAMYYFMLKYYNSYDYDTPYSRQLLYLFLSGLMMALGFATKWTVCYSAIGLAILFFVHLYKRYKLSKKVRTYLESEECLEEEKEDCKRVHNLFYDHLPSLFIYCVLIFIVMPIVIYFLVYRITPVWRDGWSIKNVIDQTIGIFDYHKNLDATHPYQSMWYEWLVDARPTWYYIGNDAYTHTIACFSHPLLTWMGFIGILYTIMDFFLYRSKTTFIIIVGYLTAFLPWVLVTRCVFAYHFYPTSFFMLLSILYLFKSITSKYPKFITFIKVFTIVSILVFILYLPVLTGFGTSLDYIHALEIFESWYFG